MKYYNEFLNFEMALKSMHSFVKSESTAFFHLSDIVSSFMYLKPKEMITLKEETIKLCEENGYSTRERLEKKYSDSMKNEFGDF